MKYVIATFVTISMLLACSNADSSSEATSHQMDLEKVRDQGRQVTALAGATLVSQLGQALAEQDAAHAVEFCNIEASAIVDSLNRANNCSVRRLTTRRRNPANKIETRHDRIAWNYFKTGGAADKALDTVFVEGGSKLSYYKPIFLAAELCLQCHGSRSTEIELATLEAIDSLYPADAAVNYVLGDLRGMWKIEFGGE